MSSDAMSFKCKWFGIGADYFTGKWEIYLEFARFISGAMI